MIHQSKWALFQVGHLYYLAGYEFPLPFGYQHSLFRLPLPTAELGFPCGWLTDLHQTALGLPRIALIRFNRGGYSLYSEVLVSLSEKKKSDVVGKF